MSTSEVLVTGGRGARQGYLGGVFTREERCGDGTDLLSLRS